MKLEKNAPAKINLHLSVGGKRDDGFHEIFTLAGTVSLYDSVSVEVTENPTDGGNITVLCDNPCIPCGEGNIAYKACVNFFEQTSIDRDKFRVEIRIRKKIPANAGLGGGSSDGAAVILALAEIFGLENNTPILMQAAANTGADLPFFIKTGGKGMALCGGKGEIVTPVKLAGDYFITLTKPEFGMETAMAYARLDEIGTGNLDASKSAILTRLDNHLDDVFTLFGNDFLPVMADKNPASIEIINAMREHSPLYACLSGSGSAFYAIFPTRLAAECCTADLNSRFMLEFCAIVRFI